MHVELDAHYRWWITLLMMLIKSQQHKSCWADCAKLASSWNSISLQKKGRKKKIFLPSGRTCSKLFLRSSVFVRCEMMFRAVVCVCVNMKRILRVWKGAKIYWFVEMPQKSWDRSNNIIYKLSERTGEQIIESNESEIFNWLNWRVFHLTLISSFCWVMRKTEWSPSAEFTSFRFISLNSFHPLRLHFGCLRILRRLALCIAESLSCKNSSCLSVAVHWT